MRMFAALTAVVMPAGSRRQLPRIAGPRQPRRLRLRQSEGCPVRPRQLRNPRRPGHLVPDRRRVRQCLFGERDVWRGSGRLHLLDLREQHPVRLGRRMPGDAVERRQDSRQHDHLRRQQRPAPDDGASLDGVWPAGTADGGRRPAAPDGLRARRGQRRPCVPPSGRLNENVLPPPSLRVAQTGRGAPR